MTASAAEPTISSIKQQQQHQNNNDTSDLLEQDSVDISWSRIQESLEESNEQFESYLAHESSIELDDDSQLDISEISFRPMDQQSQQQQNQPTAPSESSFSSSTEQQQRPLLISLNDELTAGSNYVDDGHVVTSSSSWLSFSNRLVALSISFEVLLFLLAYLFIFKIYKS